MKQQDSILENTFTTHSTGPGGAVSLSFIPEKFRHFFPLKGINNTVFFAAIFLYHVAIIFQGIDLLDEGFHVSFYQRILDDPTSVQYGFFYWFTGIVGGLVLKLVPWLGLWGLRFAGVLVSMATIYSSYRMLKNIVPRGIWQISVVLLALYINDEPKDIHYNTLSALLYFFAAWLIYTGLKNSKPLLLLFCGVLVSLNIFTRLPNVLGVGMGLVIIYEGIIARRKISQVIGYLLIYAGGLIIAAVSIVGIMKMIGHFDAYVDSLRFLFSLSTTSAKKDGLAGSYSPFRMITLPAKQHFISISLIIFLMASLVIGKVLSDEARKSGFKKFRPDLLMWGLLSVAAVGIIFTNRVVLKDLTYLLTGISTITAAIYILGSFSYEEKLLAFLGLFIMLVHPLGSAPGIMTVMIYSLWISFPMAMKMLTDVFSQDITLNGQWGSLRSFRIKLEQSFLQKALLWMGMFIVVVCVRHIIIRPYFFDRHNRFTMFSGISNNNMRFIYTSGGRAKALNELLEASSRYAKRGETVLAYDAFPMYHFMTETRPFLSSPAPLYFTTGHFENEMNKSTAKTGLPVVIRQKIWMVHEGSTWPEIIYTGENLQDALSKGRNEIFTQFLADNKYQEVWSSPYFSILLPGTKLKPAN